MLDNPPLLVVKKKWSRPPTEKLKPLIGAQTGHVVDAMDGRGGLDAAIKPIDPKRAQFVGVAITAETGPSDNMAILAAIALGRPGDCLIAASDAFAGTAVIGDNVCWLARNAGFTGLVIDGMARDLEGMLGIGMPTFARGITPNSCVKTGPGRVGFPVVAGGVSISSGDVIVGDRDGIVVIPLALLDKVLSRLELIRAAEVKAQATIATGISQFDSMKALLASSDVQYVD